jgi:hypothetical protein
VAEERKSYVKEIVIGVVVLVIGGGSAPWWWNAYIDRSESSSDVNSSIADYYRPDGSTPPQTPTCERPLQFVLGRSGY